jgi:hypothetical protein
MNQVLPILTTFAIAATLLPAAPLSTSQTPTPRRGSFFNKASQVTGPRSVRTPFTHCGCFLVTRGRKTDGGERTRRS